MQLHKTKRCTKLMQGTKLVTWSLTRGEAVIWPPLILSISNPRGCRSSKYSCRCIRPLHYMALLQLRLCKFSRAHTLSHVPIISCAVQMQRALHSCFLSHAPKQACSCLPADSSTHSSLALFTVAALPPVKKPANATQDSNSPQVYDIQKSLASSHIPTAHTLTPTQQPDAAHHPDADPLRTQKTC